MFDAFVLNTPLGDLRLHPPSVGTLERLHRALPFGVRQATEPVQGAWFGLVMQKGEAEVEFTKFQPPDVDHAVARDTEAMLALFVAAAMIETARAGRVDLVLPCTYSRLKAGGRAEVGVAVHCGEEATWVFLEELARAAKSLRSSMYPVIGSERRTRLQLGAVAFSFAAVGGELISLRRTAVAEDPVWVLVRGAGFTELPHMPCLPLAVPG